MYMIYLVPDVHPDTWRFFTDQKKNMEHENGDLNNKPRGCNQLNLEGDDNDEYTVK